MAFIKNIQGIGSITGVGHLTSSPPNVCVFGGGDSYTIGDVGNPYDPLPIAQACSFLILFKSITGNRIYGSIDNTDSNPAHDVGEEIFASGSGNGTRFRRRDDTQTASSYIASLVTGGKDKWNTTSINYDGTGLATNNKVTTCGITSTNINTNQLLTTTLDNSGRRGYLGIRRANTGGGFYTGELAIFSIYKSELTNSQKTKFASDPFGLLADLRVTPSNFHLDVDFNRTAPQLPIDLSSNNFPITLKSGTETFQTFA